ncbi:MAG: ABC transporter permease [Ignavibacteria bacterium]|nr:ABC transporter permease [Ignavibacteria bacterium]
MIFKTLVFGVIREAIAKKIFIGFFAISTLIILGFIAFVNFDSVEGIVTMSGDEVRELVLGFESFTLGVSYLLLITLCLIGVSSIIPSMLEKGNIDLLLSKPVSRSQILLGKFVGGLLLIFVSLVYLIGTIWLIVSFKFGYWNASFLSSILMLTFSFAVIYSLVIFIGITTQSSILAILINIFLIFLICPFLASREQVLFTFITGDVGHFIINFLYYILPKPNDLQTITGNIIKGEKVVSWQPVITSALFLITFLSASIFVFKKKDY